MAKTYRNPHDDPSAGSQQYLPRGLVGRRFYEPRDVGEEAAIRRRLRARPAKEQEQPR